MPACGSAEGSRPGALQKDNVHSSHGIVKVQQDLPLSLEIFTQVPRASNGYCQALEDSVRVRKED